MLRWGQEMSNISELSCDYMWSHAPFSIGLHFFILFSMPFTMVRFTQHNVHCMLVGNFDWRKDDYQQQRGERPHSWHFYKLGDKSENDEFPPKARLRFNNRGVVLFFQSSRQDSAGLPTRRWVTTEVCIMQIKNSSIVVEISETLYSLIYEACFLFLNLENPTPSLPDSGSNWIKISHQALLFQNQISLLNLESCI